MEMLNLSQKNPWYISRIFKVCSANFISHNNLSEMDRKSTATFVRYVASNYQKMCYEKKTVLCFYYCTYVWRLYEELHLQAATLACPLPKLLIYFNFESATPLLGKWRHLLNLVATRVEEAMENFVFPDENRTKWINLWPFFTCPRITPNHSNLSFSLLEISENSQFLFHCCQCQCMKPWTKVEPRLDWCSDLSQGAVCKIWCSGFDDMWFQPKGVKLGI